MREIIYFSRHARTSGNFNDLMEAGRMDIVCHVIINAFFLSRKLRDDVILHLIFYGQPDPPKHLEMHSYTQNNLADVKERLDISKKDVSSVIKKMLYKYKKGEKYEVWPGYFIEKKNLFDLIEELKEKGKEIYILDKQGEDIRKLESKEFENAVFLLGDHDGLPDKELRRLRKENKLISIGNRTYFASQAVTILNNEIDVREL
jgi:tRNA (pseudouridine54-N1)-methyltransferase